MSNIEPIAKGREIAKAKGALARITTMAPPIVAAFEYHSDVDPLDARYLPRALEEARSLLSYSAIWEAKVELCNALHEKPVPHSVIEAACARLLDELNVNAADRIAVVDGLVRAVDEACDPLARQLEMYPTTDGPIAPIVLAQGLRTVHATSKYNTPKPAELREAIVTAHWRFRKMLKALDRAEEHRSNIDALIREHAPEQIEHHTTSRVVERRAAACRVRSDVVKG